MSAATIDSIAFLTLMFAAVVLGFEFLFTKKFRYYYVAVGLVAIGSVWTLFGEKDSTYIGQFFVAEADVMMRNGSSMEIDG